MFPGQEIERQDVKMIDGGLRESMTIHSHNIAPCRYSIAGALQMQKIATTTLFLLCLESHLVPCIFDHPVGKIHFHIIGEG